MSSNGKLVFDPFPTDPLDFSPWLVQSSKSNDCTLKTKNSDDKTEIVSHLAVYLMAWRWNLKTDIWNANDTDIGKLTAVLGYGHTAVKIFMRLRLQKFVSPVYPQPLCKGNVHGLTYKTNIYTKYKIVYKIFLKY
jgi:hypothetical protein